MGLYLSMSYCITVCPQFAVSVLQEF
jgi:hypothetical protein